MTRGRARCGSGCRACPASGGGCWSGRSRRNRRASTRRQQPATSGVGADIIARFIAQHRDATAMLQRLDEQRAAQAIMTSPFIGVMTYSVLDGWRLIFAHDRRHIEQARRVMSSQDFPGGSPETSTNRHRRPWAAWNDEATSSDGR